MSEQSARSVGRRDSLSFEAPARVPEGEAPRSSLLRRSSHFSYEGRKIRGIRRRRIHLRNLYDAGDYRRNRILFMSVFPRCIEPISRIEVRFNETYNYELCEGIRTVRRVRFSWLFLRLYLHR